MKAGKQDVKKGIQTIVFVVCGNALLAFAVAAFVMPHRLIIGGTTGIALILQRAFGIDTALIVFILNAVLLLLGLLLIGKKLFLTSIAGTVIYPLFLALFQKIPSITAWTENTLLAALFAGVLMGAALGLTMRVGASTGGMDIAGLILNKYLHKPVALFVYLCDIVIVGVQALVADAESIMLGIVVLVLESLVLGQVMVFGQAQIQLYAVSEKHEQIKAKFLNELQAGVTLIHIQTGLRAKEQEAVMCIIPSRKLYHAIALIHQIDPDAFITITKIKEVQGRGFTKARDA
ncbi:MAG: YitT family protein [Clostridia bacterium]|nr:YitT family protein [Clostridia bacterium]